MVDNSQTPRYVETVVDGLEFNPSEDGFYTIVAVGVGDNGLEFSDVGEGMVVPVTGSDGNVLISTVNTIFDVRSTRCGGVVAGGSCQSMCPITEGVLPTGGACRADAGVVLHQRALNNGFECISQNDTSFVEVEVYCLDISRFMLSQ